MTSEGRKRKTQRRKTGGKVMGMRMRSALTHNDRVVEGFIDAIQQGRPSPYLVGIVRPGVDPKHPGTVAFGSGMFSVWIDGVGFVKAKLRGDLFAYGAENPVEVEEGKIVLVEDLGLGHMARGITWQIMGVPLPDQAHTIRRMLDVAERSSSGPEGFTYNRGEQVAAAAANRLRMIAEASRGGPVVENAGVENAASGGPSSSPASNYANLATLEQGSKVNAKKAKQTRRRERRAAKKAEQGQGRMFW